MPAEPQPAPPRPFPPLLTSLALAALDAEAASDVLALALREVCAHSGWPVGHALLVGSDGRLRSAGLWELANEERFAALRSVSATSTFGPGEGLPGRVLASRGAAWIPDVTLDDNFTRARVAGDLGVRAAFAFPVPTPRGIAAVLEFFSESPAPPDDDFLALITMVGLQVGRVFERATAAGELRERESRFRAAAENAAEGIVTITQEDAIIYANPAVGRMFGYSMEELGTLPFSALMPERFRDRHREGMRRYTRTGERRLAWDGVELPGLHRDGREIPMEVTFGSFEQDGGRFFTGIMRDISARKRAEAERHELLERERAARGEAERRAREEEALRQAAAAVSEAFTAEETARRIAESALVATRADAAFVELIRVGTDELEVVAACGDLAPEVGQRCAFTGSLTQQAVEREEPLVVARLDDVPRHLVPLPHACDDCALAVVPLLNAGEPIGALHILRRPEKLAFRPDEVQRAFTFGNLASLAFHKIHLLEDSERKREELEEVMESRSRLIRGFSHDVKNPIGAADGFLQLIQDGVLGEVPEGLVDAVGRSRRALKDAIRLIDDLLDIARAEAGQLEIRPAPTDLREAAREMAEEQRARAEMKGLTLEVELPERYPLIESDPTRVRQVAGNLLSNAVKYTPEGGTIRVCVDLSDDGFCRLSVSDTGPGIPAEKFGLLFQEFARLDPTAGEGLGIGLAISRRVAHALGGDIQVASTLGKGSVFTLLLPQLRGGAPADDGEG